MNKTWRWVLPASAAMLAVQISALAQNAPATNAEAAAPTVALRSSPGLVTVAGGDRSLDVVLKEAAAQAKVTLWVEPGISQKVSASINRQPFETAVSALTGEQGPYWAKVEIVQNTTEEVPAEALYDLVRAFNALPTERMVMGLSKGAGVVTLSRGGTTAAATPAPAANTKRIVGYAVAKRKSGASGAASSGDPVMDQFSQATQQRYDLMQQMSPDQRAKALQSDMLYLMQLSPEDRRQLGQDVRQAWQTLPDDLRQQMQRNRIRPGGIGGFGGGGRRGNRGNGGNNANQGGAR